jgi:hypothetical protein
MALHAMDDTRTLFLTGYWMLALKDTICHHWACGYMWVLYESSLNLCC